MDFLNCNLIFSREELRPRIPKCSTTRYNLSIIFLLFILHFLIVHLLITLFIYNFCHTSPIFIYYYFPLFHIIHTTTIYIQFPYIHNITHMTRLQDPCTIGIQCIHPRQQEVTSNIAAALHVTWSIFEK